MELKDGKIRLRPLRYADRDLLASLANNKKIWNNLRDMFPHPYTLEEAEKFLDMVKQQEPLITFAIEYEFQFCGVIGLLLQQDVYRKSAEIGYWIGEPYWGKGIVTKALTLATQYAFDTLELERLFANIFQGNEASKNVLEKCGFQLEGVGRKAVYKNNRLLDELRFGKLKGKLHLI
jgi:RimJ/RimL family protein N-acetyltransferase